MQLLLLPFCILFVVVGTVNCQDFFGGGRQVQFGNNNQGNRPGFTPAGNGPPGGSPTQGGNNVNFGQPQPGPVSFGGQRGDGSPQRQEDDGCSIGVCKFYSECALFLPEIFREQGRVTRCVLSGGIDGICCNEVDGNRGKLLGSSCCEL